MATPKRKSRPSIIEEVYQAPFAFNFHQVIRILEAASKEEVEPLGEGADPNHEAVKLISHVTHAFNPSDLEFLKNDGGNAKQSTLAVNFFGIAGNNAPLPTPYMQLLLDRVRLKDHAFRDFLDIFNHRLISILHRVRKKYRVGIAMLYPEETFQGQSLLAASGAGDKSFQNRSKFSDQVLIHYAGLFWKTGKNALGLARILNDYYDVKAEVEEMKGRWFYLSAFQWTHIGNSGQNQQLSHSAVLGTKSWDQSSLIVVKLGPMPFKKMKEFFRTGNAFPVLSDLVKFYLGKGKDFILNLGVEGETIPETKLGKGGHLGWSTWLSSKKHKKNDYQVWIYPEFTGV